MEVLAHRGDSLNFPENTLEAFESALLKNADGLELDVHLSKDQQLVVIHDEIIDRTSNGKGKVRDYTLKQLKLFDYSMGYEEGIFDIPSLEEVFQLLEKHDFKGFLNIEAKTDKYNYPHLPEILVKKIKEKNRRFKIIISSFNFQTLEEMYQLAPDFEYAYLMGNNNKKVQQALEAPFIETIHPKWTWVKKNQVELFHFPKKIRPWTINEETDMRLAKNLHLTGIITDNPTLGKRIQKED